MHLLLRLFFTSDGLGVGVGVVVGIIREFDPVKMENQSRKRSHKLDRIGVGRIRTCPFLPIPFTTPSLVIQWKLDCRSRKQKRKNQPIAMPGVEHCHWFIPPLLLATPTMKFPLDRLWGSHKQNQCSASDPAVWFSLTRLRLRRKWKLALRVLFCIAVLDKRLKPIRKWEWLTMTRMETDCDTDLKKRQDVSFSKIHSWNFANFAIAFNHLVRAN